MIEVQIFIPTTDNNGNLFPLAHHAVFELELLRLFGASSQLPGTVTGQWTDAGTVYRDTLLVYLVAVSGLLAHADPLREVVNFAKAHYAQLNIYVRYLNVSEVL